MEHKVNLTDISDGKIYGAEDMVRLTCDGCGKHADCCRFSEATITLDPYDLYVFSLGGLGSFSDLYSAGKITLTVSDGLILPILGFANGACSFLDGDGRCSIHSDRPGLCRLFPLARGFSEDNPELTDLPVFYLRQKNECPLTSGPKVKIKSWIGIPDIKHYEAFCLSWHRLLVQARKHLSALDSPERQKEFCLRFIHDIFYTSYASDRPFFEQWEEKIPQFFAQF